MSTKKPAAITHLNAAQKRLRDYLSERYSDGQELTATEEIRIEMMATIIAEIRTLQKFVNAKGTTYEVVGRSGDVYSKHRPEHQQLVEARQRLHIIAGTMERDKATVEKSIADLLRQ